MGSSPHKPSTLLLRKLVSFNDCSPATHRRNLHQTSVAWTHPSGQEEKKHDNILELVKWKITVCNNLTAASISALLFYRGSLFFPSNLQCFVSSRVYVPGQTFVTLSFEPPSVEGLL